MNSASAVLGPIAKRYEQWLVDMEVAPNIEFAILSMPDESVNAYVHPRPDGTIAMVLTADAAFALHAFYHTLLSSPRTFMHVGHATAESDWILSLSHFNWCERIIQQMAELQDMAPTTSDRFGPRDPLRSEYARRLSNYALDFLFQHEFAHIFNGDLALSGNRHVFEFGSAQGPTREAMCSQVLEIEADRQSAMIGAVAAAEGQYSGGRDDLSTWIESIAFLFSLLDPNRSKLEDYDKLWYPHPAVRLISLLDFVAASPYFKGSGRIQRALDTALESVITASRTLQVPSSVFEVLLTNLDAVRARERALISLSSSNRCAQGRTRPSFLRR